MLSTKKFTQEQIKEINRVNIINLIRKLKTTTKQDIANTLHISIPTITSNINELIEDGLVEEVGIAKSTGGRKPVVLGFVKNARFSFGVSITRRHITLRLINLDYEILSEKELPYIDMDTTLGKITDTIMELLILHGIDKKQVVGIGVSLPGVVDDASLILEKAPNLRITNYDFHAFEKNLGIKVWIENEANIAAFAELKIGNAVGISNLVYVSITEGIGTGIIIKSHIYKSNQKKAGEFGHTRVTNEQLSCNCGRTGCWELYASKEALVRYYKEISNTSIDTVDEVFDAYEAGSHDAKEALTKYIEYLFYGIENIILGLNPDYMIIGGDFGKYKEILLEVITATGKFNNGEIRYEGSKIIFSGLEDKGPLVGASLLPLEVIFNHNENVI